MQGNTCHRMSYHPGRGCPRGRGGHGARPSAPTYRPQNLRLLHPQQPPAQYQYEPPSAPSSSFSNSQAPNFMPPRPDFVPYPPPVAPSAQGPLPPCPVRPPYPNHQMRHPFPVPPCFPPMPPPMPCPNNPPVSGAPPGQGTFPFMVPPPSMPHPPPPPVMPQQVNYQYPPGYSHSFPPPNFNSFQNNSSSFPPSANNSSTPHFRHLPPYSLPKAQSERRSPERLKHYDDHRHRDHSHGRGERHRSLERRERGRSPERRRPESRYRSEYDRGRTPPPRHRSYERSRERERERHRHRENRRSPSLERAYKKEYKRSGRSYGLPVTPEPAGCTAELPGEIIKNTDSWAPPQENVNHRSPSREKKRARWEEEKDRWSDSQSSGKEKSYTSIKEKEPEEAPPEKTEEEDEELLKPVWIRCTHSESYYSSDPMDQVGDSTVVGTSRLRDLYDKFEEELGNRQEKAKAARPPWEPPKTKLDEDLESSSESECETDEDSTCSSSSDSEVFDVIAEIKRKKAHPDRLHDELWYNDPGQMNDGPLCKCSAKARRTGIRHSIYPGEEAIKPCRPMTNNAGRLFHYRITVSPPTNFLTDRPTVIEYDDHEYIFEGFSMFAHAPLTNIPLCKVIRFNIDYTIHFIEEMMPENFCVKGLELFSLFLFRDILELYDWNLKGPLFEDSPPCCPRFHFMPRFVRFLPDGGKEVLSMHQILLYLLRCSKALVPEEEIANMLQWEELEWQKYAEECKGMIVTNPGTKPSSVRIDQLDREQFNPEVITFPIIVHFGIRPAQLSYAGDPQYQKLWKSYVKLRHLLANSPKVKQTDKQKLAQREEALQKIRQKNTMRREVTVELSSQGFWKTGIRSDVCQHAMMLPVLTHHIRYHQCLMHLDKLIGYTFQDRCLLQLAMTHPSHHLNFGMNPDHARNSLSNCGIRQPKYGDRKVHHMHMRKKGINTLINIMSRLGQDDPTPSRINHNERLEFLGDAVVEFLTSVHLYYLFPSLEEGGLATYRTAIVQNQHLAMLAKKLELDRFMLYAHGPDLCRESDLRHAMANCFEALIGAVYLEGTLEEAKQLFGRLLFNDPDLREVWLNYPLHPLQLQEPNTDRQLIETSPVLQKLTEFEEAIGVIFTHVRLLARAFTLRTVGFNHLTLGHNQRMEFLGDSIMQLVATEYLFIHFPDHHEGHLTLLRSSLVNNRTQAKVAEELGMQEYAITNDKTKRPVALRTKTLADLLESFIAALYIDKDLEYVHTFMNVCFFPRLKEFILNQDWNDPKSQLQQCCLTLRTEGKEPDIPLYKTLQTVGPSHARTYTVAVYFKGERIGCGKGPSIQQAEMGAAMDALEKYNFPQMAHQKRFIERKYRQELKEMRWEREHQEREPDEAEDIKK
ncbi:ribonuclease 3 isoform X1 [Rattus norvegicus]|uniref:Ribonuclease 3 n=1 Tax=Rattus norvegicus TaxID=10116 RepID=E9PTR3_RAT|nr:ribonuclease 3 [Rattus norvegicus]XP_038958133.1 ribonuclease 3 isoform X1 [Rattus norvegicus]XP_038958134.1 ribonuclease 3 isoform X1 [Rattus norvegicus]XP_038958135.1 ribonuclease 3 isoform X1 [Rattus norvegicus]|eukprot:NP_001101125.2 ribonuclease 3 [Rattus norvegicus]